MRYVEKVNEKLDLTKQYIEIQDFYSYKEKCSDKKIREVKELDFL